MDTEGIQISNKIEFKRKLVYCINEGSKGYIWNSNWFSL